MEKSPAELLGELDDYDRRRRNRRLLFTALPIGVIFVVYAVMASAVVRRSADLDAKSRELDARRAELVKTETDLAKRKQELAHHGLGSRGPSRAIRRASEAERRGAEEKPGAPGDDRPTGKRRGQGRKDRRASHGAEAERALGGGVALEAGLRRVQRGKQGAGTHALRASARKGSELRRRAEFTRPPRLRRGQSEARGRVLCPGAREQPEVRPGHPQPRARCQKAGPRR